MRGASRGMDETPITVKLESLECHTRASVELSAERFRDLSAAWKVNEKCPNCGRTTDWSFAEAAVEAEEQVDFWDWLATTGEYFETPGETRQDERRKERRIEVHVPLRIRAINEEEEEVMSENISRSGLAFPSTKSYGIGSAISVTLRPPGAPAPHTKDAMIVRLGSLPDGRTLYGARLAT